MSAAIFSKRNSAPVSVSGKTPAERLQNAWIKLQTDINCYMDSDLDKLSLEKVPGIRQVTMCSGIAAAYLLLVF